MPLLWKNEGGARGLLWSSQVALGNSNGVRLRVFGETGSPSKRPLHKGRKSTLGYKGFARCDEEGFIGKVHVRPANAAESPEFETMTGGGKAQRVPADKAYARAANRARPEGRHRDGIRRKAVRGRPPRASEKRFDRPISKRRFRIGRCFGTMKRLFGLHRARYFGTARTHAQMIMAAISPNLPEAADEITLRTLNQRIA